MKFLLKLIGYGFLGLIILGVVGNLLLREDSTPKSQSSTPKENWEYTNQLVGIDKNLMLFASTTSTNSLNLRFPYNGTNKGELTIRKTKKNGTELIFEVNKGQFLCDLYTCSGKIKFDSSPSIRFTGSKPADHSSNMIFLNNSTGLIESIKKSKKASIEIPMYQEGNQILEFNVEGLDLNRLNTK
jgi:hypothetical protein